MMQTVYIVCPRGHRYRAGRFTAGLYVRINGPCPVCRDVQVTTGMVTPFENQMVTIGRPHRLTAVTSDAVRRQLAPLSDRPEIKQLLQRIPRESVHLSVREVVSSMEAWLRHKGSPGGAVSERNQRVEILGETNDPRKSILYLREQLRDRCEAHSSSAPGRSAPRPWNRLVERAAPARDTLRLVWSSARRELQRACVRLGL